MLSAGKRRHQTIALSTTNIGTPLSSKPLRGRIFSAATSATTTTTDTNKSAETDQIRYYNPWMPTNNLLSKERRRLTKISFNEESSEKSQSRSQLIANKSATSSATSCYEESDELAKQGREIRRVKPVIDEAIHHDNRALGLLLEREELTHVTNEDIKRTQQPMFLTASSAKSVKRRSSEIDDSLPKLEGLSHPIRSQVIESLCDICQKETCDAVVFPLAVSYLDRFIAARFTPARHRMALASACLLVASKMNSSEFVSAEVIAQHSENAVDAEEILDWEFVLVNQLDWNLNTPTSFDFFDQMVSRSPVLECMRDDFVSMVHKIQREVKLATLLPSKQAAICLLTLAEDTKKAHLIRESKFCVRNLLNIYFDELISEHEDIITKAGLELVKPIVYIIF